VGLLEPTKTESTDCTFYTDPNVSEHKKTLSACITRQQESLALNTIQAVFPLREGKLHYLDPTYADPHLRTTKID